MYEVFEKKHYMECTTPPPTMENRASQLVPLLMAVELEQYAAPDSFLINIG